MSGHSFILPPDNREPMLDRIRAFAKDALPGKRLKVTVEEYRRKRSDDQNRALWGVAYKMLSDATGNDASDLHTFFLGEHFGWETIDVMGQKRRIPARRSSRLTTAEFAEFYEFIQRRAAEVGYYVPSPGEADV